MKRNYIQKRRWNGLYIKNLSKRGIKTTTILLSLKIHIQVSTSKLHQLSIEIASRNTSKQRQFFVNIRSEKVHPNDCNFSLINIEPKKACQSNVDFLPIEIVSKKVRLNDVNFLVIKITSIRILQNDVDFSPIEITSKNYLKMTWDLSIFSIWCIDVLSVSDQCQFGLLCPLGPSELWSP